MINKNGHYNLAVVYNTEAMELLFRPRDKTLQQWFMHVLNLTGSAKRGLIAFLIACTW